MNVYGRNSLRWKENELYFQDEHMISIIPDKVYSDQFRVLWLDGVESETFYNKTRTKDHSTRIALDTINKRGIVSI